MTTIYIVKAIGAGYERSEVIGYFATKAGAEAKVKALDPRTNPAWPAFTIFTATLEA
jgi:hypothetical protein